MAAVIVRFKVADPERWFRLHQTLARERVAVGIKAALVFDDGDEPDHKIVIYQVEDLRRARAYLRLDRNREREIDVGVSDQEMWLARES